MNVFQTLKPTVRQSNSNDVHSKKLTNVTSCYTTQQTTQAAHIKKNFVRTTQQTTQEHIKTDTMIPPGRRLPAAS
jgi:hypothetical protein